MEAIEGRQSKRLLDYPNSRTKTRHRELLAEGADDLEAQTVKLLYPNSAIEGFAPKELFWDSRPWNP
jgi:hypothetical protein